MLKLVSVNIERSKHLDLVLPLIERERPDVLCIQELLERDIPQFAEVFGGAPHIFAPTSLHPAEIELAVEGIGIFSGAVRGSSTQYYRGSASDLRRFRIDTQGDPENPGRDMNCALLSAHIEKDAVPYTVGTTHFTWSREGVATGAQRTDVRALLSLLGKQEEFILCGDFNAPRGGEIFEMLASRYTDHIPPEYKTSIDVGLHRAGKRKSQEFADKMVDGLFTTPGYLCANVRLVSGVSDHMAVVAEISKGKSR